MGKTNIGVGGGGASSSGTSHTESWIADQLEPVINSFISGWGGINYENSVVAGLTPAEKEALDRFASGNSINTGAAIAKKGGSLVEDAVSSIQDLLHGGAKTQFMSGVSDIYNGASSFIAGQDSAIQDSVYSEMGQTFGQTAQNNMASTSVAGSSVAQNATNSVLASGANEMTQMMADVSGNVLKGAVGLTSDAIGGEVGLINELMGEGGNIFQTGASIAGKGASNQFKAGLFEQWFNQGVADNNRKNNMINNNMDLFNMGALLEMVLPTAGIDTTTTTKSSTESKHGGFSI